LGLPGVTALAAAALWVSGCGGHAPRFASAAAIAAVIDDNQLVIGQASVRKYVSNLRASSAHRCQRQPKTDQLSARRVLVNVATRTVLGG
jgi:hypothetical protein